MSRVRILIGLLAVAVFGGSLLLGDDTKTTPDTKGEPAVASGHHLPQGWRALGLTDEQKKKVYAVQDDYAPKIAALKKQIEKLQDEEHAKMYEVLSDEQKKRLKDIRETKDSGGKKEEKKP